jgi:succinoglycan biosynthesis transport protein ExoP
VDVLGSDMRSGREPVLEEPKFDLRGALGVLRRHLRLLVGTFIVVVGAAALVVLSLKPVYTASALVLVDTTRKDLMAPADAGGNSLSDNARVDSEVELAKSESVLLEVVKKLGLSQHPDYAYRPGIVTQAVAFLRGQTPPPPTANEVVQDMLSRLRDAVNVQRRGLTFLISVQGKSSDPQMAATLANAVADTYIAQQLRAKVNATLSNRDIVQARLNDAASTLASSEDALDDFIRGNINAIAIETGRTDLVALNDQILQETRTRSGLSLAVQKASQSLHEQDYAELSKSLQSSALEALIADRQRIQVSLDAAGSGQQQAAIDLRSALDAVEQRLRTTAETEITTLQRKVSDAQAREADLKVKLRGGILASNLSSSTLTRIYEFQQSAEIARTQYQNLIGRLKDLDQQSYLQVADSRLASPALPPFDPSFPNFKLMLALAALFGAGLGVALAFLYENVVGGIVSEEQLRAIARTHFVLSIPKQGDSKGPSLADAILSQPLSVFSESVRRLRASVEQAAGRSVTRRPASEMKGGSVILITSTAPREGKTTTSLALARAYVLAGKTVLLIDCDLRKPSLHKQVGKEPARGLLDYLSGTETPPELRSIVQLDEASGASVLLGSRMATATSTDHLVAGKAFGRLLSAARQTFDVVILDTPPIGPVVDAAYMAQFADVAIFAVKWATTGQSDVRSGMRTLIDAVKPEVEVISVLTQTTKRSSAYYNRKYAGYYTS